MSEIENKNKRYVVVVDRGWIFAGDMTELGDYVRLDNAVHIFKWTSIGFTGVISDPYSKGVDLRHIDTVEIPVKSVIFRIPVADGWGKS